MKQCDLYLVKCMIDLSPANYIVRKPLADLWKRLLHMRMALLDYNLRIIYVPERRQSIADALSRNPTDGNIWPFLDPATELCSPHNKVGCNFAVCFNMVDSEDPNLNIFYAAVSLDENYNKLSKLLKTDTGEVI